MKSILPLFLMELHLCHCIGPTDKHIAWFVEYPSFSVVNLSHCTSGITKMICTFLVCDCVCVCVCVYVFMGVGLCVCVCVYWCVIVCVCVSVRDDYQKTDEEPTSGSDWYSESSKVRLFYVA